jgi:hypothetical protein
MMNRRHFRNLVSSLTVLLLVAGSALATTFTVPYSGKMGASRIDAGRYNITWEQHSPDVTVTVAKGKEVVATAKGRLESRSAKFQRNMVVYTTQADGSQTITELRIGGTNTAIVFSE